MIKINLLPPELIGKKKAKKISARPSASLTVYLILIPVYLITLLILYRVYDTKTSSKRELDQTTKKLEKLKKDKSSQEEKFRDLKETFSLLNDQIEILRALDPPNRLLWSEKINMISELIPKGVFLTSIKVTEKVEQLETAESKKRQVEWNAQGKDKKGTPPEIVKKPVIRQTLEMEGITYSEKGGSEERLALLVQFHQALKTFKWKNHYGEDRAFMDNFNPEIKFKDIQDSKVLDKEVSKFTFIITTKPFSAELSK